jgi:glycine/D-amino acid oxidase-like deaminating enzyme
VVVAAGPWTPELVDPGGRWRPIRPLWGVVAEVGLADPPRHVLEEAGIDETIEPGGEAMAGVAFSLVTADRSSVLGSTFLDHEPDAASFVPAIVERGAGFVPAIAGAAIVGLRSCARPLSLDGRPLVGRVPWADGLLVAAGHGPWGISTGPAAGRMIADVVLGRDAAIPAALDPGRFGYP